jgi:2-isopropylmalate synthase
MAHIELYDTTLRDGTQGVGVSFSVDEKIMMARRLDDIGIRYIEGGWPGSNPKDISFFQKAQSLNLKQATITAFGSTRRAKVAAENDANLNELVNAKVKTATIFGKSWDFQVTAALRIELAENLAMIFDSVSWLRQQGLEVIYDAEHFFDGYKANPDYAISTLKKAAEAGAVCLVLCDTNGGCMPSEIAQITKRVVDEFDTPVGIHAHNDSGVAVANSLAAVEVGATHVQGTINGYGERCGNANLISIIPNLQLKMGYDLIAPDHLASLTTLAHYTSELANLLPDDKQPFVGLNAFAHKGGIHVSAIKRDSRTYEHVDPTLVGNTQRVMISELSGQSNIRTKLDDMGISLEKNSPETLKILETVKEKENQGYTYEAACASMDILVSKILEKHQDFFELNGFRVIIEKRGHYGEVITEATVRVKVGDKEMLMAADGTGPVDALDHALRKALETFYPELADVHLTDYKVRVIDAEKATAAQVRVLIESRDHQQSWCTVGVSPNLVEASWQALVDSIDYKLLMKETGKNGND